MKGSEQGIEGIRRLAARAERRVRLGRALAASSQVLCAALGVALVDLSLRKLGWVGEGTARAVLALGALGVAAGAVTAWLWRLPPQAGARALDRHHGLDDRLSSALAFASQPAAEQTPFMAAAIDDALGVAAQARPGEAVPVRAPRSLLPAAGLALLVVAVGLFEVRKHVLVAHAATIDAVEMSADDLDDVKDFLKQMEPKTTTDETKAAVEELNRLVEDIAQKRLDRTEAFRRMESLEQKLLTGSEADKKALEEQAAKIGEELKKAELTRPAGEAMADNRLDRARDQLHELAQKLKTPGNKLDAQKLAELKAALAKASAEVEKRRQELEARRQELADELLKKKQQAGADGGTEAEQSLLQKKQRELDRLDREMEQQTAAQKQLDRLDRDLAQAAEDLMKDLGLSAQDLEQGAEDMNHLQEQQQSAEEKEQLRQKIEELRQLLRQQGQGGKGQVMRLQRFSRMARGQGGQGGQQGQGQGQQGQGEGQEGQGQGQNGQGQSQGGQGQGQGGQGQSQGGQGQGQGGQGQGQGGETWIVGPNGEKILMLSRGGAGQGSGQGGQGSGQGGQGQGKPGRGWGEGHDPNVQGGATQSQMGTQDTQVQGADTGSGGSRSQVILGAAERGFASKGYGKVYTEYHQVAEESLAKDDVPGGYRFYVKRYFQLIRPREGNEEK